MIVHSRALTLVLSSARPAVFFGHPQPGIFTFNPPQRTYFIFRQPIPTSPALGADRDACHSLYKRVKGEVEGGMGYLLRKRETDPYKNLLPRLAYEATWGFNKKAPSFDP